VSRVRSRSPFDAIIRKGLAPASHKASRTVLSPCLASRPS